MKTIEKSTVGILPPIFQTIKTRKKKSNKKREKVKVQFYNDNLIETSTHYKPLSKIIKY
jgi:hypothetical protein